MASTKTRFDRNSTRKTPVSKNLKNPKTTILLTFWVLSVRKEALLTRVLQNSRHIPKKKRKKNKGRALVGTVFQIPQFRGCGTKLFPRELSMQEYNLIANQFTWVNMWSFQKGDIFTNLRTKETFLC
jgi:hypothetical protein